MKIQLKLFILTAYTVNFERIWAQPLNEMDNERITSKVNDASNFQEKFQNLFDAIGANDARKSEIHRDILQEEVLKERQAFDVMKEEIRTVRNKNSNKRNDFVEKSHNDESIAVTKRAVKGTTQLRLKTTVSLAIKRFHWAWPQIEVNSTLEDDYMEHFGNNTDPCDLRDGLEEWHAVRACDYERGMEILKEYCARVHEKAGRGTNITVNAVMLRPRQLLFQNYNYESRRVDVLSYGVEGVTDLEAEPIFWFLHEGPLGYITKGKRPDCVYYLRLLTSLQKKYSLHEHVCGIEPVQC